MDTKEILSDSVGESRAVLLQAKLEAAVLGKLAPEPVVPGDDGEDSSSGGGDQVSNLSSLSIENKRLARRPDTDHLKPGTVQGPDGEIYPLFNAGDKIIVERSCSFLPGNPWLDTYVYEVLSIDDHTGVVQCLDHELGHRSAVSFKSQFQKVFLCPKKGNPFTETAKKLAAKEDARRGEAGKDGTPADPQVKKGRGRPKGTKNRPKDVILAEKKKKAEEKKAKRASRASR